jgi:hypothetical protein
MKIKMRKCDVIAVRVLCALEVFFMAGCQQIPGAADVAGGVDDEGSVVSKEGKKFTFTVKTNVEVLPMHEEVAVDLDQLSTDMVFSKATSYLNTNSLNMTDLWVLDYMNGKLVQQIHQTPTDSDWGKPTMMLAYGSHHVYFIASRGATPVLDTDAHTITWGSVRDTFAKDYEVSVVNTSNGNRAVTMDRIVTKLKVTGVDEVPATCASISVTPSQWFYGYDYVNDAPVASSNSTISLAVPSSYVGTTGLLSMGVFSISGTDEWNTSVVVRTATSADVTLGQATITDAPFLRNRSTEYSGNLFSSGGSMTISMNEDWLAPHVGEW